MKSLPVWVSGSMFLFGGLCPWSNVPSGGLCLGGGGAVSETPRNQKSGSTHLLLAQLVKKGKF